MSNVIEEKNARAASKAQDKEAEAQVPRAQHVLIESAQPSTQKHASKAHAKADQKEQQKKRSKKEDMLPQRNTLRNWLCSSKA